jgi:hypothetical protein
MLAVAVVMVEAEVAAVEAILARQRILAAAAVDLVVVRL